MATSSSSSSPFPLHPHRTPDDTLFFSIFSDDSSAASLPPLHLHILRILAPYLHDYLWHHDPFLISISPVPCAVCGSGDLPHLHGKLRYGDNLEDEWFAVFLLFAISREIPSVSIRVWDSDGEFLLIEAAYHLPRWLNPDSSPNRVFIRSGLLHIIPKSFSPSTPSLSAALSALRSSDVDTVAPEPVQSAIGRRLSGYPDRARANIHRVRARFPLPVALVLKHEPCLISLAVEAFYDRDVDSMKHAAKMEKFLSSEMVRVSVRMTRAMYAQLVQQDFRAPKGYPMARREEGKEVYAEAELGMKIACGFEMMYQVRRLAGEEGKGETWEVFKKSLENSGCFDGLLPGSKEYKRIMDGAMECYRSSSAFLRTRDILYAPVQRIDEILSLPHSADDFKVTEIPPNDDDSWLYNGEDELNSVMLERQKEMESYESGCRKNGKSRQPEGSNDFNLGNIAESMQAFVQKISSFEGAEVPGNRDSKAVELDFDQFMKEMASVLGPVSNQGAVEGHDSDGGHSPSSDMEYDDFESGSDLDDQHGDDETEDSFMQTYSDALNKELNETTLNKSFVHAQEHMDNNVQGTSSAAAAATKDVDEELTPVDVDVNLVQSFLDSFASQQGLPGPASNLLGLMGLKVPQQDPKGQ
ncbi:Ecd family protein [Dioscorea alata]|uniref:Ecd family protein n=1 Tax=Dioscorea alata TaxID=55571 RepID=A0ACB7WJU8_DIOAL|nr:Ecd family protein [Dioscorea alata]